MSFYKMLILKTDPNVDGVTIVHRDGIPIKSSLENKVAVEVWKVLFCYKKITNKNDLPK